MIKIGLLGLGNVGKGVIHILKQKKEFFSKRLGQEIQVTKALVRNINAKRKSSYIISKLAQKDPSLIKPYISDFFSTLSDQDSKSKIILTKSLLEIAKTSPEIIPINEISVPFTS